jgi:hypothetical protein
MPDLLYQTSGEISVGLLFWAMIGIIAYAGIVAPWWRSLSPARKQAIVARFGNLRRLKNGRLSPLRRALARPSSEGRSDD